MATKNLRNVAILGHGGDGKTTLTEALLFNAKVIDRLGRADAGTTASDFEPEEKKRKISISAAIAPIEHKGCKINFIDVPGYFDFVGEMLAACSVADGAVIVLSSVSGVNVGTEKAWDECRKNNMATMLFVNQMDKDHADFHKVLADAQAKFGTCVAPIQMPILENKVFKGIVDIVQMKAYDTTGAAAKEIEIPASMQSDIDEALSLLTEAVAETDEELMMKYFDEGTLSAEDIKSAMRTGVASGAIVPVLCGSAYQNQGIDLLADAIADFMPSPDEMPAKKATKVSDGSEVEVSCDVNGPFSAFVFKTIVDPMVGKLSLFKVMSGKIATGSSVYNPNKEMTEKIGNIYTLCCAKRNPVNSLEAGDIGAFSKLVKTASGDTLCDSANQVQYPGIEYPVPAISIAIACEKEGDEDKVFSGLNRLTEEDPTFTITKNLETLQTLMSGTGEMQLDIIMSKLKAKFGVGVVTTDRKVAYRETIRKTAQIEGKHKKQSGGHGQYGHVWIRFEPITDSDDRFQFAEEVVGGVVPKQFIPAVEKGLNEAIDRGPLAGYPITGLRAVLYDGSYHPVDSNEMSFKTAAKLAFRKLDAASPVLLEPIMSVSVSVPDEYMGDIIGDLNKRRGRILGMDAVEGKKGMQKILAEVPEAEIFRYATDLRSMTQGRGSFTSEFLRYEEVPQNISAKVVAEAKKNMKEDED